MKKTILTSLLLFAISICNANQSFLTKEDPDKIDLEKGHPGKESEHERTFYALDAYLYKATSIVEVELFNIGTATVTITNSYGDIVCSTSANTSLPVVLSLAIPSEGDTYFIEISSASWYARGFFNL